MYKTDSKIIGLKFAAIVAYFSPFLSNLKIAVLRVIVNFPLDLLLFTAFVTKAPKGIQNFLMKFV